jgi:hypothetical protein
VRDRYADTVEEGRVVNGPMASKEGSRAGCFVLHCPRTRAALKVIASDGSDWDRCGFVGPPWEHVSVSARDRCPTWEEMCWVKELFWGDGECVLQFHPPKADYVNCHPFVLHLWRCPGATQAMPPTMAVGPKARET